MKHSYFSSIILALVICISLSKLVSAQVEWAEPVNISNLGGYLLHPDIVIDHNGVIHAVWSQNVYSDHWLIYYAKSEDDGLTWTVPLDLLQNTDYFMSQPHIACDSENKLYVTYTHDGNGISPEGRLVKMIISDGHQWSDLITVSEGMPGSHYSSIAINIKDKPYVFWLIGSQMGGVDMYYRYYNNMGWSNIFCPYCDSTLGHLPAMYSIEDSIMHWSGVYQVFGVEKPEYYVFKTDANCWEYPERISNDTIVVDIDIALNNQNIPESAYRIVSSYPPGIGFEGTMHTKKDGIKWLPPELVSGTEKRQVGQQIAIDQNNDAHVVETQYYISTEHETELVHYCNIENTWFSQAIDFSDNLCHMPKLVFSKNKLYVVYVWDSDEIDQRYIRFSKYDVITAVKDKVQENTELKIYPNPGAENIFIEFVPSASLGKNAKHQQISLSVFDLTGKLITTLANQTFPPGKQQIIWKGTDQNGKKLKSGSYIVRLKSGRKTIAQKLEIIR